MKTYHFKNILQKEGWQGEAFIEVSDENIIQSISHQKPSKEIIQKNGLLFPGFQNAHSHAFQYAMAGLNEGLSKEASSDDFWSWRENMYSLALNLSPDEMENIATNLYKEMVRHGYTHVAEFHYLHHDKNGSPYSNLSEMGERLMSAAQKAGIQLTLIPMFYQMGGFNKEANERQKRFLSPSLENYLKLFEAAQKSATRYKNVNVGIGVHSLRAVKSEDIIELFRNASKHLPKHLHISEQTGEVDDCLKNLGKRPVEWLLENVELDHEFHLVHATHINQHEIAGIIQSQANVVICPSTEANLGDGLFPLLDFHKKGGHFSIGTDSHIGLSPMEELRWLDYGVRLIEKKRNPLCQKGGENSGELLYHKTYQTGLKAMGLSQKNYFEVGSKLQGYLINDNSLLFKNKPLEHILSTLIYSAGPEHLKPLLT